MPQSPQALEQFLTIYLHYPNTQLSQPITGTSAESKIPLHISSEKGLVLQTQFFIWAKADSCLVRDYKGLTCLEIVRGEIGEVKERIMRVRDRDGHGGLIGGREVSNANNATAQEMPDSLKLENLNIIKKLLEKCQASI